MIVCRTDDEINRQLNLCVEWEERGGSGARGMSYEQGVLQGIRWLIGDSSDVPIEEGPGE